MFSISTKALYIVPFIPAFFSVLSYVPVSANFFVMCSFFSKINGVNLISFICALLCPLVVTHMNAISRSRSWRTLSSSMDEGLIILQIICTSSLLPKPGKFFFLDLVHASTSALEYSS